MFAFAVDECGKPLGNFPVLDLDFHGGKTFLL